MSEWFDFPLYKPARIGLYRIRYRGGSVSPFDWTWNGYNFERDGFSLSDGAVEAWQGWTHERQ